MGGEWFETYQTGKTAQDAFDGAVKQAEYDYGHRGYTGTIAEKTSFVIIPLKYGYSPELYAEKLNEEDDERICDKWGDAGCIEVPENFYDEISTEKPKAGEKLFLFFGWASS